MGKYLVLWRVVQTQIPIDPKERGEGWGMLMAMVRKDIEKGITKDWGAFVVRQTDILSVRALS